jgi:flagellar motility protein MotE (MotC chaperone)
MIKLPAPRLLPLTITTLSMLLVVKCGVLVQAVVTDGHWAASSVVTQAKAADGEKTTPKPVANQSPPLSPPPSEPPHPAGPKAVAIAPSAPTPSTLGTAAVSESEKIILQELRQRRKELDTRESDLAARESMLAASEQKLAARVGELQALQKNLEGLDASRKQKEDAGWQGLVKMYEAMKPKDAATIFNELSMPVLLQVLDRMKDAKAAQVMAAMSPDEARDVTSELAQLRTGHDPASDMSPPGTSPGMPAGPPQRMVQPGPAAALKPNPAGG